MGLGMAEAVPQCSSWALLEISLACVRSSGQGSCRTRHICIVASPRAWHRRPPPRATSIFHKIPRPSSWRLIEGTESMLREHHCVEGRGGW